jgi:hypothetical protein
LWIHWNLHHLGLMGNWFCSCHLWLA